MSSSRSFLSDDHFLSAHHDYLSSRSSFQEPSARSTWRDDYESAEEDIFDIPPKGLTTRSLQRWKKATLVLNAARRFRYTTNDSEEQRQERLRRLWNGTQALRAANLFLKAGALLYASDDFKVEPQKLVLMIQQHKIDILEELGGITGVISLLKSNSDFGPNDDPQELEARKKMFGSNTYARRPSKPFWVFIIDASKDLTLIILIVCAILTFSLGMKTQGVKQGWYDGVSIAFAVIIVILVTSISDYRQSLQFSVLNEEKRNIQIEVVRGGRRREISIFQIVVGDIVLLNIGDQVPADGLFVDGHSLYINQSSLTGESEPIHVHHRMPFLTSGGKVDDGHGVMVVTAVGMLTEWGQLMAAVGEDTAEETPLQVRLNGVATLIGKVGTAVAVLVFCVLFVFYFVGHTEGPNNSGKFKAGQTSRTNVFNAVVSILETAVTIVVVAVPEGLPLAVTLTLAYAMKKMIADKALVRRLSACETMGCATTICSDKTGTLTLNQMMVVKAWAGGDVHSQLAEFQTLQHGYLQVLFEGLVQNSNGTIFAPADGGEAEITGSPTEKAILMWGLKLSMDYASVKLQSVILQVETFNSVKKRAGVAVRPVGSSRVHVHWKGAAEILVGESDSLLHPDNYARPISTEERDHLLSVIEGMASDSLRCIAFAYMDMDAADVPSDEHIEEWKLPAGPLTLIAIVGIKDPARPEVPDAVHQCQLAGIRVRMVTGDNIMTAKAIALECGILRDGDLAVEGATFRDYTPEVRAQELPRISVMARSLPSDKLLMVKALKELGEVVAVTGDGTNDAPALREADIGLAMGIQGTEVAKESSDIVIMDDNFASVVKVVRWGRSVYRNIQKFIQFQLTVNVAALTINLVAAVSSGDVPLTAVQLLWVNLIMDTLGALALATERPTDQLLEKPPVGRREPLISNVMWRNILSQAFYQIAVLLVFQFRGKGVLKLSGPKADDVNNTIIFNAFVFCQLFNEVNCRKLEEQNVFRGILTNWLFLGIVGVTVVLQVIIVEFLNKFASTIKLEWKYWGLCVAIGLLTWVISFFVKFIPVPKKPWLYGTTRSLFRRKGRQRNERQLSVISSGQEESNNQIPGSQEQ